MKRVVRSRVTYVVLAVLLAILLFSVLRSGPSRTTLSLSDFEHELGVRGSVVSATIHDNSDTITGQLKAGGSFEVSYPDRLTESITAKMTDAGVPVKVSHAKSNPWVSFLINYGIVIVLIGVIVYVLFSLQGGGSRGVLNFGKAKAKTAGKDQPKVTFADVAGADEAVAELQEIKEFLEAPGRFHALGAKIPKGVLLFGPPGTGKTLLARAVAGEAGVPFFSISGSDFVEMFVGVGASRVRDLFDQAKANAPSIVFMDEIDAVGRHRGAGLGGGHDEREQTLNQLLVELDGFDIRGGVILIAATNRPDILDPALLRPGRFDRQIVVDRPDLAGRRKILEVHAKGKPLATSADLDVLAKRTPGFTGADLANLLNEAAILAARRNLRQIGMRECEEAIDRVLAGPERKTIVMSEHDKLVTAYHEAGHAIVGHVLPNSDPIHKVSIVARSRSLGLTYTLPEDRYNHSRSQLRDAMAMCLGGRTAEELVFAEPTTGAENDIEKVTRIARAMVTEYGMSDRIGPQQLAQRESEVFLGRDFGHQANYSEEVAADIDNEVRALIDEAHARARAVLTRHRDTLESLARALVEKETLDNFELEEYLGALEPWGAETAVSNEPARKAKPPAPAPPMAPPTAPIPARRRPISVPGRRLTTPVGATRGRDEPVARRAEPLARTRAEPVARTRVATASGRAAAKRTASTSSTTERTPRPAAKRTARATASKNERATATPAPSANEPVARRARTRAKTPKTPKTSEP